MYPNNNTHTQQQNCFHSTKLLSFLCSLLANGLSPPEIHIIYILQRNYVQSGLYILASNCMLFFFVKKGKKKKRENENGKRRRVHTKERGNLLLIAKESNTRHQERHPVMKKRKKKMYKKTYKK